MRGTAPGLSSMFTTIFPLEDGSCVFPTTAGATLVPPGEVWEAVKDERVVRVHGYKHAIPVLCSIYEQNFAKPVLVVGTPQPITHLLAKSQWEDALAAGTRLEALRASLGGWRKVTVQDYDMFSLVRGGADNVQAWARHPAAKAVHFIADCNGGSVRAGFQLVSEIIDPRWFVDPRRPNNNSRLYAYLGALPSNAKAVLSEEFCVHTRRAKLLTSWCLGDRQTRTPWSFLVNMLPAEDQARGWLAVMHLAIDMLKAVWLDSMSVDRDLFVPAYAFSFFPNGAELAGRYNRYSIRYHNG